MSGTTPTGPAGEAAAALCAGDAARLAELLEAHPELKSRVDEPAFPFDTPAVVFAASRGDRAILEVLLAAGADINAKSRWWAGPYGVLHQAPPELAPWLLEHGARLDAHAAARFGMRDRLAALLDADPAGVAAPGPDGQTPLHMAVDPETAALLVDRGAPLEARCVDHGGTPAQYAACERLAVCRYLLERGAAPDVFMAVALGDVPLLQRLLAEEPERLHARTNREPFTAPGSEGGHIYIYSMGDNASLLHAAAHREQPEIAAALIDAGLDVNVAGDYDNCTPLHMAAWNEHPETARVLLDRGADIERSSGPAHHNTPLGWAIVGGSVRVAALLLERGAGLQDWYLEDARAGEGGSFSGIKRVPRENYTRIAALLRGAGAGG